MECGEDGCTKMKFVCKTVDTVKKSLFGEDGISGVSGAVAKKVNHGTLWTVFAFLAIGLAGGFLYLNSSIAQCNESKADKAQYVKIMQKLDTLHDDVVEIKASQKATETYIKETKPIDARQTEDIRKLQLENARGGRNGH